MTKLKSTPYLFALAFGAAMAVLPLSPAVAQTNPQDQNDRAERHHDRTNHDSPNTVGDNLQKRWNRLDSNHDGDLSKDEYVGEANERFNMADANHDGKLTREEVKEFVKKSRKMHREARHRAHQEVDAQLRQGAKP